MNRIVSTSAKQTIALGEKLAATLHGGEVIAFTGGLGAGKTTFCRGLAKGLHTLDDVSSPTFSIVNYYRGPLPLAHFDAYRIEGEEDLEAAGYYEYHNAGAVIAIEWSERIAPLLGNSLIRVDIQTVDEHTREITIEGATGF